MGAFRSVSDESADKGTDFVWTICNMLVGTGGEAHVAGGDGRRPSRGVKELLHHVLEASVLGGELQLATRLLVESRTGRARDYQMCMARIPPWKLYPMLGALRSFGGTRLAEQAETCVGELFRVVDNVQGQLRLRSIMSFLNGVQIAGRVADREGMMRVSERDTVPLSLRTSESTMVDGTGLGCDVLHIVDQLAKCATAGKLVDRWLQVSFVPTYSDLWMGRVFALAAPYGRCQDLVHKFFSRLDESFTKDDVVLGGENVVLIQGASALTLDALVRVRYHSGDTVDSMDHDIFVKLRSLSQPSVEALFLCFLRSVDFFGVEIQPSVTKCMMKVWQTRRGHGTACPGLEAQFMDRLRSAAIHARDGETAQVLSREVIRLKKK